MNLKNKVIIVTGGGTGVGAKCAVLAAKQGARVIINYNSSSTEAKKTLAQCETSGGSAVMVQGNVTVDQDCKKITDLAVTRWGGIDGLINNAGITKDNLALRMKEDEWKEVIDVNLNSVFFTCQIAIKAMIKNKSGSIVNITSVVGHTGNAGQANYTASKAGVVAMTKSLAKEYAKKNIRVNCVSPGFIATDMTKDLKEEYKSELLKNIPINRLGTGEDIANAVIFLCSSNSSYITGETIHVNGGMYMS